jgi:hypothetical protein
MTIPDRIIAIDWSGSKDFRLQRKHIQTAIASEDGLALFGNKTREELINWLKDEADCFNAPTVIGLDFAFSFPLSYFEKLGVKNTYEMWSKVEEMGEEWMRNCQSPFWGKPGKKRPETHYAQGFRATEKINIQGILPKSIFQISGAGAVGTGSMRGMPFLKTLHDAGFSIWPFDPVRFPLVVEIYPRLFTGAVHKSNMEARRQYLASKSYRFAAPFTQFEAEQSEDAFDAVVSAAEMYGNRQKFAHLTGANTKIEQLEGQIWGR